MQEITFFNSSKELSKLCLSIFISVIDYDFVQYYCRIYSYSIFLLFQMSLLKPSQLPVLSFVRFKSRHPRNKLKIPEDKTNVIIGKWKPSIAFPKPGVSDKAVNILLNFKTLNSHLTLV